MQITERSVTLLPVLSNSVRSECSQSGDKTLCMWWMRPSSADGHLPVSPGARSILHKNLKQRKIVFQWVLYGPKGRNSPDTGFFSVALTIWGGSKVNFPLRTRNKFESF